MKRTMAPVYIGDVGVIVEPVYTTKTFDVDANVLAKLPFRELCIIAVEVGFDVRDLIGVSECSKHAGMVLLADKVMPDGYNLFDHCTYCKNCWQLFRLKRLPSQS